MPQRSHTVFVGYAVLSRYSFSLSLSLVFNPLTLPWEYGIRVTGNYINFGVFDLYKDPALNLALGVCLKLALTVPLSVLPVRIACLPRRKCESSC